MPKHELAPVADVPHIFISVNTDAAFLEITEEPERLSLDCLVPVPSSEAVLEQNNMPSDGMKSENGRAQDTSKAQSPEDSEITSTDVSHGSSSRAQSRLQSQEAERTKSISGKHATHPGSAPSISRTVDLRPNRS